MTPGDIPRTQQLAAASFGKLVAQGIIETKDAVEVLFAACLANKYAGDHMGLRTRLWHLVHDEAERWHIARIKAEYRIRDAIMPHMEARSDGAAILRAAYDANDDLSQPFLRREVLEFTKEEMRAYLAGARRGKRAYGR